MWRDRWRVRQPIPSRSDPLRSSLFSARPSTGAEPAWRRHRRGSLLCGHDVMAMMMATTQPWRRRVDDQQSNAQRKERNLEKGKPDKRLMECNVNGRYWSRYSSDFEIGKKQKTIRGKKNRKEGNEKMKDTGGTRRFPMQTSFYDSFSLGRRTDLVVSSGYRPNRNPRPKFTPPPLPPGYLEIYNRFMPNTGGPDELPCATRLNRKSSPFWPVSREQRQNVRLVSLIHLSWVRGARDGSKMHKTSTCEDTGLQSLSLRG